MRLPAPSRARLTIAFVAASLLMLAGASSPAARTAAGSKPAAGAATAPAAARLRAPGPGATAPEPPRRGGDVAGVRLRPVGSYPGALKAVVHHQPTNALVVASGSATSRAGTLKRLAGAGAGAALADVDGVTAADGVRARVGRFAPGEILIALDSGSAIARVSAEGASVRDPWVVLPERGTHMDADLCVDRTGVFEGDLLVATRRGNVWRVDASGRPSLLAALGTRLRGVTALPDDAARYGPWAGRLLVGAPRRGGVFAVDALGNAEFFALGVEPQDLDVVAAGENFFGIDALTNTLWAAPASDFAAMAGDVLVAQASPGVLWRVRWDGARLDVSEVARAGRWRQVTFSTAGAGSVPATVVAGGTALARHAPSLASGRVEGSLQQLAAEDVTVAGGAVITNDLRVPGTPAVSVDPGASFGGVVAGPGDVSPSNYQVTLAGNATLGRLVTRTNPVGIEAVAPPPPPSGTRDVTLTKPGQSAGDFATLRNLTLAGKAGAVSVPPGTYGAFAASSQTAFVLGVAGAGAPAVYNLQSLSLTGRSALRVVGPVVLTVAGPVALDGQSVAGAADHPEWLTLKLAAGGLTVAGGGSAHGSVTAPAGAVTLEGGSRLAGTVAADRLVVNGGAVFQVTMSAAPPSGNQPPTANAGPDQTITLPAGATLDGAVTDDGLPSGTLTVTWSVQSGPGTVTFGDASQAATTAAFSQAGTYVLRLTASDSELSASDDVTVTVQDPAPTNHAPTVDAGADQTVTLPSGASLGGSASDDGLPNGTLVVTWSKVSGPGAVAFGNANQAATTASFGADGTYVLRLTADDSALTASDEVTITVNPAPQTGLTVNAGADQTVALPSQAALSGGVAGAVGPVAFGWSQVSGPKAVLFAGASSASTSAIFGVPGSYTLRLTATDSQSTAFDDVVVTVTDDPAPPPPDPASVAPPVEPGVTTTIGAATQFLYTGPSPIQTGVAPGTIDPKRVAVLRGRVRDTAGAPLPKVAITVLGHPELGQTLSRADGMFDLAVNGGGFLTLRYEKSGFLPVQRKADAPWQDFVAMPDVVMMGYDPQVALVDPGAPAPIQVAQGSASTDSSGTRRSTLFFAQGTTATMTFADGSTQPLPQLHVRSTEYTVGPNGPAAMPGELPATSAYTYAVELSVDEAVAAGATSVLFSQPVVEYLDNFLNFPAGTNVPAGSYDRARGVWNPEANGRVVKILSVGGGLASLDVNGGGVPATDPEYAALGITAAERQQLAALFAAGRSFWRVPVSHFSPHDFNYAGASQDAVFPDGTAKGDTKDDCETKRKGSIIECESQTLGERVGVVGTPFTLNYRSSRVPGRVAAYSVTIPLSGPSLPASLKRIELVVGVAGQVLRQSFPPLPNQSTTFTWDGRDGYGRVLQGRQGLTIRVGYVYEVVYYDTPRFGQVGNPALSISNGRPESEITYWQTQRTSVGAFDARGIGLGGWTLSEHHAYDPNGHTLFLGDGRQRQVAPFGRVISLFAGNGVAGSPLGDGLPAAQASVESSSAGIVAAPDGTVYVCDPGHARVRKVAPDGVITTVAGNGLSGYNGDNIPATQARLNGPISLALGPDGSLYISDQFNQRVRRVSPDGVITTVAGTGVAGFGGDGGPATGAQLNFANGIAVAADGSLYICDSTNARLRRVAPDGVIGTVVAGGAGTPGGTPITVAVGPDGLAYYTGPSDSGSRLMRVNADGTLTLVAGGGSSAQPGFGDGGPATQAYFVSANGIAFSGDGSVFLADYGGLRVRVITPDGVIHGYAGNDAIIGSLNAGDGGPAQAAGLESPGGIALGPDGTLFISTLRRVRAVGLPFPGFRGDSFVMASSDGSELYEFGPSGRHLRTVNALTSANRYVFSYDTGGRLAQLTDGDGNVTTVERSAGGDPTGILGPDGQRTTLALDPNGFLSTIADPASQAYHLAYTSRGLLTGLTDPRNQTAAFEYGADGRLTKDTDAATGFQQITRTELADGHTASTTTALGRTTQYQSRDLATGVHRSTTITPGGAVTVSTQGADGTTTTTLPDGTVDTVKLGGDPRFMMQTQLPGTTTTRTPAGLLRTSTFARAIALATPGNPLSLTTQNDTLRVNNRPYTRTYTAATRTLTSSTPVGRQSTVTFDAQGRRTQHQFSTLTPTSFTYDARGRLVSAVTGAGAEARSFSFGYTADGYLASITDPLSHTSSFAYDAAGRVTQKTFSDGRVIGYGYDANGNLASVTPPGRPAHTFAYTVVDERSAYTAPSVGGPNQTAYAFNLDRQLVSITRPGGQALTFGYDPFSDRLSTLTTPGGAYQFAYHPSGLVSSIAAPGGGTVAYAYDGVLLKQLTWTGAVAGSVSRAFDNTFRITSVSVNGANPIALTYDNDNLLTGAGALGIARSAQTGQITGTTLGGMTDASTYTAFGQVASYAASFNGGGLYSASFTYDKLGRVTQRVETVLGAANTSDYTYDAAGRLTQVKTNNVVTAGYGYDANGNRTSATVGGSSVAGTYDDQDRLTQYGATSYAYSAGGELTGKTAGGQVTSYEYDVLANLRRVVLPGGTQIDYVIDGQDRRVGKKVNGALVQGFLYQDATHLVAELDGANAVVSRFVYGSRANVPDSMIRGGATYRIVSDHLGSPRLVVDVATGVVVQQMAYDEFGVVVLDTNPGFQPFGFAGGLYDKDTGLVHFGARDYDAQTGRWTAKDPILFDGGSTNLYGYVLNDPVNGLDPLGLAVMGYEGSVSGSAFVGGGGGASAGFGMAFGTSRCKNSPLQPYASKAIQRGLGAGAGAELGVSASIAPFADVEDIGGPSIGLAVSLPHVLEDVTVQISAPVNKDGSINLKGITLQGTISIGPTVGLGSVNRVDGEAFAPYAKDCPCP